MPRNITIVAVLSPAAADTLMHHMDVFETFKRLIMTDSHGDPTYQGFTIGLSHDRPDYPKMIATVKTAIEGDDEVKCLAVFCPGNPVGAWRDETCTHVSNGKNFTALMPLLLAWGFVPQEVASCQSFTSAA